MGDAGFSPCVSLAKTLSFSIVFFSVVLQLVSGSTDRFLERESIVYGLATVASSDNETTTRCDEELRMFSEALEAQEDWAIKMMDASGDTRSQFTWGNNFWFGSERQCRFLGIDLPVQLSDKYEPPLPDFTPPPYPVRYNVAYCRQNSKLQVRVHFPNEELVQLGLCLPLSCSAEQVERRLQQHLSRDLGARSWRRLMGVNFTVVEVKPLPGDDRLRDQPKYLIVLTLVAASFVLVLAATIYEVHIWAPRRRISNKTHSITTKPGADCELQLPREKSEESIWSKLLMTFSAYTNISVLTNTKLGDDSVPVIHGIRFLGMVWIIMVHIMLYSFEVAENKVIVLLESQSLSAQILANAMLSVDTFFFLSGFLVAYMFYHGRKKTGNKYQSPLRKMQEFVMMVIRRYVRLTPPYIIAILLAELASWHVSQTTQFHMTERNHNTCHEHWWRNILYINNLYPRNEMCLSWSWYLSNDMQFFVLASALMFLSTSFFKMAASLLVCILALSTALTMYVAHSYDYALTMDEQYLMMDVMYDPPWTRVGPYLVGVVTGYLLVHLDGKLSLRKAGITAVWILSWFLNLFLLFCLTDKKIGGWSAAIYASCSRTAWGLGLAWAVLACSTGHGGYITRLLSWPRFVPLSRLTYCMYLLNPIIIHSAYFLSEVPLHLQYMNVVLRFVSVLVIVLFLSFCMSLVYETPNVLLTRILLKALESKPRPIPRSKAIPVDSRSNTDRSSTNTES